MAKKSKLAKNEVRKGLVDRYDERRTEPTVLPSKFPNLLVNGANGIAVGMATNIAPNNLGEIADAIVAANWLLIAAGVAYVVDTAAHGLLSDYESYASLFLAIVAIPSMVGEGWLALWLLRTRRWSG